MEFSARITELAARSRHASKLALTEEATKTSVILPFIQALGFDVFSLDEVIPEFVADVGIKKGEKIDFAIRVAGKVAILIEAKPISMSLGEAQYSQLYRYFSTVEARLAILINGREVWFFSDIDERNKMDKKPFFVFDLQNFDEKQVKELARFQKANFDIDAILEAASNLKWVKAAATYFAAQMQAPEDDFVRMVGRQIYDGTMTKSVMESLRPAIQAALDEVVRNRIQERLNVTFSKDVPPQEPAQDRRPVEANTATEQDVVTTDDELLAFNIVRAIGAAVCDVDRISIRDAKTYCSVFVDDNNRRPVCRFYFNSKNTKFIGLFSASKEEEKLPLQDLKEIYKYAGRLRDTISHYAG